jgi:dihydrofolate reductase
MRKIIVLAFISLDGVMQAPGGPEEDTSGGFKYGGWIVPYFDDSSGKLMGKQMQKPFSLLLGRKTFKIFESYWPQHEDNWPGVNDATKYVVSRTLKKTKWQNSVIISKNVVEELKKIKKQKGPNIQVHGSTVLIQTLLKNDLVDELWLKTFPLILGKGKRLFSADIIPKAFRLKESVITPSGVIFASYEKAGEVKTGSFE